jgi:lipopolysaccharide transport system ATP-binding protein
MSDVVIRAQGLGKKYLIGHQTSNERYVALRDVMARTAKGFVRSAHEMLRGRQLVAGDQIEEFWALRDVNFEIKRGEVVGVIGRNGAGKSTLLKVLSRITEPSSGRIEIKGRVASLLEVGTGFHPELSGRENIFLNGAILGMTRQEIKRKFDEIVNFAEIEKFLDTSVKRYSSGMYVRLAFAVAAHLEPEILVVDEVLSVGDADFRNKCLVKMREVTNRGRTILFVSHDISAVTSLCSRGMLLSSGQIAFIGTVESAIDKYARSVDCKTSRAFNPDPSRPSICEITLDSEGLMRRDLIAEISFESPWPLSEVVGGIVLRTVSGTPVWSSNPKFHKGGSVLKQATRGIVICEARSLPLVPGQYLVSIWLGNWQEDFDIKQDILRINFGVESASAFPAASITGYTDWPAVWSAADSEHKAQSSHSLSG